MAIGDTPRDLEYERYVLEQHETYLSYLDRLGLTGWELREELHDKGYDD